MDEKERQVRKKLRDDFSHYASKCLKIRSKAGDIIPFILNKAQTYIHFQVEDQKIKTGKVRAIILKGRQQGCSSYIEGRFYWRVTHRFGARAFILTHDIEATNNLFEMAQRYHDHCPSVVKPSVQASNAKELIFSGLDSGYKLGTAGNKAVGRSSTIQLLHGSEVGYWPNAIEHAKGIMQAVPDEKDTEIFIESTANGVGNYFHQQWQLAEAGLSDYIAIFVPWFWQDEYKRIVNDDFVLDDEEEELQHHYQLTINQLAWRRAKINELSINGVNGVKAFKQEYPCNANEAFQLSGDDTYIDSDIVMRARKELNAEPYGPLLIGVDPARFGDDRTSIIRRQGRVASKCESYIKKDTMEVTGIVHKVIETEKPMYVFVDVGGLGAGVVDRLYELGHRKIVIPVNAGSTPYDKDKYVNKRAEMWGLLHNWLTEEPCKIPDMDTLHADLCGIKYTFDSNSRLKIESKQDMKKRGLRSSDEADALCLTFAYPISALSKDDGKDNRTASKIMGKLKRINSIKGNHPFVLPTNNPFK